MIGVGPRCGLGLFVKGMPRRRSFRCCALVLLLATCPSMGAKLNLSFVDEDGRRVELSKAELLVHGWRTAERIDLEPSPDGLTLVLEPDWLRSRWWGFAQQEGIYLHLHAPPFDAIRSQRFRWPVITGYGIATAIGFPGDSRAVVKDQDVSMTLVFRPPRTRRVRLVDPAGAPLPNVPLDAFWHWGYVSRSEMLIGRELLGEHVTDADGVVEVLEGGFKYALSLGEYHVFQEARYPSTAYRLITWLTEPTTEFVVRQFGLQPLTMRVRRDGAPAVGLQLRGELALCPAVAACDGPMAATDDEGLIQLDDFRPDEFTQIWLVDHDNGEVWRSDTTELPAGVVALEL